MYAIGVKELGLSGVGASDVGFGVCRSGLWGQGFGFTGWGWGFIVLGCTSVGEGIRV